MEVHPGRNSADSLSGRTYLQQIIRMLSYISARMNTTMKRDWLYLNISDGADSIR